MLKIPDPIKLSVLSWNIDGLDERDIDIRTLWICNIINKELPDIVMLQEVIDESSWIIRSYCQQWVSFFLFHHVDIFRKFDLAVFKIVKRITVILATL